ncbi:raftlin [Platichthys flesus]|uniref:raftlin n=1 Tax=Platichthys flesus TaxID=8260 RepID=UPI002DB7F8C9|nr:raftlin [Platichthys flesus]
MGCRLPKLRKAEEKRSPGNIYSTLRRPQVETKVGVSYTYHFLDFLLGKEEVPVSSVLCLSSVRELPVQVRELYAQGFVLVAVHPFVHPCGPRHAHIQRQLHRAVLVRETPSSEKSQLRWARHRLDTDVCVAGHQAADPEVIQSYVKRIQDVAEQGMMFVGFLQQPGGAPCFLGQWDPEELSSLHSSPSPIHRNPFSASTSPTDLTEPLQSGAEPDDLPFEPRESDHEMVEGNTQPLVPRELDFSSLSPTPSSELSAGEPNERIQTSQIILKESLESTNQPQHHSRPGVDTDQWCPSPNPVDTRGSRLRPGEQQRGVPEHRESTEKHFHLPDQGETRGSSPDGWLSSPELERSHERKSGSFCADAQGRETTHNNNHIGLKSSEKDKNTTSAQARMQLFALYNHTGELNTSPRFYSLRVPLQLQKEAGLVTEVDAHWLDHMTQHFTSGARLVDGFFQLGDDNESGVSSVDSVFILQSSAEDTTSTSYDAIVVEQWTVVDGVVVKTDYIPLLQSLAPYGWRLMCVLPTPIVKTNSDGSLSTKQILFLQRPVLQRKRKDFKMLNLRGRSKAKRNSAGEDEREIRSLMMDVEMDRLRRNTNEEEAEARRRWDGGRSDRASHREHGDEWEEEEEEEEDEGHQRGSVFLSGSRFSVEDQEEETDIDLIPLSKQEKCVRWTEVCQRDDGGVREEVKTEERIKQQLFSGVC